MPLEAWYMDDDTETDQRLPHHKNPPEYVSVDEVAKLGILFWDGLNW